MISAKEDEQNTVFQTEKRIRKVGRQLQLRPEHIHQCEMKGNR